MLTETITIAAVTLDEIDSVTECLTEMNRNIS